VKRTPSWTYRAIAFLGARLSPPTHTVPLARARAQMRNLGPALVMGRRARLAEVTDGEVAGVRVRRYVPHGVQPGLLLFFHGGGWVVGDLESHDVPASALAAALGREVVAVDYRLAPEHPYPAALEDCLAVTRALSARRPVVAGDSAGGNLAAAVAQALGGEPLTAQVLIYPVTDCAAEHPSYAEYATGHLLTAEGMRHYVRTYLPDPARRSEPGCSPLRAPSLRGLPPALVLTAGCDVLRDEGVAYAERLRAEGVEVHHAEYPAALHGFFNMQGLPEGVSAVQHVARWLAPRW
jgi:acetyl esterase